MPASRVPFVATPPITDAISAWGIGGIAVVMAVVVLAVCWRWRPVSVSGTAVAMAAWLAVTAGAALSGRLARFDH